MYVDIGLFSAHCIYSQLLYSLYIFMVAKQAQTSTVQQEATHYHCNNKVKAKWKLSIPSICRLPVFMEGITMQEQTTRGN